MCPDGATYLSTGCLFQDKDVIIIISLNVIFTQHEGGLNATINNISVILWWFVLLLEETRVPG
jgi:hypothetical protein